MRCLAILSLLAVLPSVAQAPWGGVGGQVTDPGGFAISNADIAISSDTLPRGITTRTDDRGSYNLQALPVGVYTVTVAAPGFHSLVYHHLEIRLGVQLTFNARLSLGSVSESIEVNDPAPPSDMASSQTATQITADAFEALARGRSSILFC